MVNSALATSDADILIYTDSDDRLSGNLKFESPRVHHMRGNPQGRGLAVNALCDTFREYRNYLVVSDDITFIRSDWDVEVNDAMKEFPGRIGCVHLASEIKERYVNWATVSREWLDTLGWFNYPGCGWFCQDTIIQALAEALDRITFIEPQVLQHHVEQYDETMKRFEMDAIAFLWYMAKQFGADLKKLQSAGNITTLHFGEFR